MKKCIILLLMMLGVFGISDAQQVDVDYIGLSKREERTLRRLYKDYDYRYGKRGYFGQVSANATFYMSPKNSINDSMYGVDVVNGYSFGPHFDLGGCIGLFVLPNDAGTKPYYTVPLSVFARVNFLQRKVTPYLAARLGCGYTWDSDRNRQHGCLVTEGVSAYAGGEVGAKLHLKDGMAVTVGFAVTAVPFSGIGLGFNVGFTW